jgi:hypothetical protein
MFFNLFFVKIKCALFLKCSFATLANLSVNVNFFSLDGTKRSLLITNVFKEPKKLNEILKPQTGNKISPII